ncbi:MAG: hypothetical protein HGA85_03310 [Nanoarchaeota archaeon]|nr:hypothetical protein [Nanoarchaeota archaeon]
MAKKILVTYDTGLPAYNEYIKRKTGDILTDDELKRRRNEQDIFDDHLFAALSDVGVDVAIFPHDYDGNAGSSLSSLEAACESAEVIVHSTPKVGAFQCQDDAWRTDYQHRVEDLIYSRFLHKTEFNSHTKEVTDKRSSHRIAQAIGIPVPKTWSMEKYLSDVRLLPVLFKTPNGSRAEGNLFLDREEQLRLFFDEEANARCGRSPPSMDSYDAQEYINTPSNHFTHYRIFTLGDGTIVGAVLGVSGNRKDQLVRRAYPSKYSYEDTLTEEFQRMKASIPKNELFLKIWGAPMYDHVLSPLYLGLLDVFSNHSNGGTQIALTPTDQSRAIAPYEKEILVEHRLNPDMPQLPAKLEAMARRVARAFAPHGLLYIGQDWLQDRNGNFYFLEVNSGPGLNIFNTLYNFGRGDETTAMCIGTRKLAEALREYTPPSI